MSMVSALPGGVQLSQPVIFGTAEL